MFTEQDYRNYFDELENIFKKALTIYTDLLNEIGDQSVRNKLHPLTLESSEAFRFIRTQKGNFSSKTT
ncbi:MAG: hypothetical protein NG712_05350 [Omnitrophica bacterium]|nr:hypothetical protein [Candidatus Omnitrophota bacterium]